MADANFFQAVQGARKVLALDLGFLGDTIHLLPALKCVRDALPDAQLDVMAGDHIKSILEVAPWLDNVLGYPRFPTSPGLGWHIGFIKQLRAAKYDAVINLNGSDRSAILTWLSGAPLRLGRVPPKQAWFWPKCFTHTVEVPFKGPVYRQRWDCLTQVGFPGDAPDFGAILPEKVVERATILTDGEAGYIHVSPFATQDNKELTEAVLAKLLNTLIQRGDKVVLSCAPNNRERGKLTSLLAMLETPPWKVFDGTLNLLELAAVIARSKAHLGGDSGALHVALMSGAPTLSWWRDYEGRDEWQPIGDTHRAIIGRETPEGLEDITVAALLRELDALKD